MSLNSIVPTTIEGVCVYDDGVGAEFRNFIKSSRPIQQMGRLSDVANAGEYRAEDLAAFVSGQHLLVTGVYGPRCAKNCWHISQQKNLKPF